MQTTRARSDVVVVNTCSFISEATEESIATILDLVGEDPSTPSPKLVVTGCMPSRYGDDLVALLPEVSAFIPAAEEASLLPVLEQITGVEARIDSAAALENRQRGHGLPADLGRLPPLVCLLHDSFDTRPVRQSPARCYRG